MQRPGDFVARIGAVLIVGSLLTSVGLAREVVVKPLEDTDREWESEIQPGDEIVLSDGQWEDADLTFEWLRGTQEQPIQIRPETPGQVVFTGATEFRFSGEWVTVSGFVFRNTSGASDVMQSRTHSERLAHHCRITDCLFEETSGQEGQESRWLSLYGSHNRVDHCSFTGKSNRGPTLVVWVAKGLGHHRVDHNYFGPRPELGRNGGETIRIGTSDVSELDCHTVVEDNYFERCNGEAEAISNKSCQNVYRHNVFYECSGTLTLRHGHRCIVEGNLFLGNKQRGTGGVRIIGEGHQVINNYFEGLRGDEARAALCLMNGIPNGQLHEYAPVRRAMVAHNTFLDCKVSIESGVGNGAKQSADPQDCLFSHNLLVPGKWEPIRSHSSLNGITWKANQLIGGSHEYPREVPLELVEVEFEIDSTGLTRPKKIESVSTNVKSSIWLDLDGEERSRRGIVGCDDPTTKRYNWPTPESTGPLWR